MSYSSAFADRMRKILSSQTAFIEKEMFGGVACMFDDKMCVGINQDKRTGVDRLMARIDPEFYYSALKISRVQSGRAGQHGKKKRALLAPPEKKFAPSNRYPNTRRQEPKRRKPRRRAAPKEWQPARKSRPLWLQQEVEL